MIFELFWNMHWFEYIGAAVLIIPPLYFVVTSLINSLFGPYLEEKETNPEFDVSMIIPIRNNENSLHETITSLLEQDHSNLEIIIIDINSSDNSYKIAHEFERNNSNVFVYKHDELLIDDIGKLEVYSQFAEKAKGKYLIFTQADKVFSREAVSSTISAMAKNNSDVLRAFPTQRAITFSEKAVLPGLDMIAYSGIVLRLKNHFKSPVFVSLGSGWTAFRKNSYFESAKYSEDMDNSDDGKGFRKSLKQKGVRIVNYSGKNMIFGRRYSTFGEIWVGLSKILYSLSGFRASLYFVIILLLYLSSITPFVLIWTDILYPFAAISVVLNIIWRLILAINCKHNILISVFLHPLSVFVLLLIAIDSFSKTKAG